jgi:hypothetical protein
MLYSKTKTVKESIHNVFDDKKYDNKISGVVESFVEIQVSEDTPESTQESEPVIEAQEPVNPSEVPETDAIHKANPEDKDSEEEAHYD